MSEYVKKIFVSLGLLFSIINAPWLASVLYFIPSTANQKIVLSIIGFSMWLVSLIILILILLRHVLNIDKTAKSLSSGIELSDEQIKKTSESIFFLPLYGTMVFSLTVIFCMVTTMIIFKSIDIGPIGSNSLIVGLLAGAIPCPIMVIR
ncbi:hypothetical protein ACFL20_11305 [Spirochaetota bacterium]